MGFPESTLHHVVLALHIIPKTLTGRESNPMGPTKKRNRTAEENYSSRATIDPPASMLGNFKMVYQTRLAQQQRLELVPTDHLTSYLHHHPGPVFQQFSAKPQ